MDRRVKVLYVDDSAAACDRASAALGPEFDVESAADGPEALDRLAAESFDCVVCGGTEQGDDWHSFLGAVRGTDPSVPIVLFDTLTSPEQVQDAVAADLSAFVPRESDGAYGRLGTAVAESAAVGRRGTGDTRSNERFDALFENIADPAIEYRYDDGQPVILAVNRAFTETFGYDRADVIGEQIPDVIVPEDKRDESRALVEQMRTAERVEAELTRETTTGHRDFLFRNITVDAPTAGPDGYALYIDITERKEHERTLQRQNERLDEFASVVSHDLRNPMEVIKNRIQVTQQTGDESYLDQALDAVDRMDELLRDLRQLAQQGEQIGRPEPVDLEAVAETAWEHVATGDATLVVETDATVEADRGRLTQLLENLYINAVDHSTANGGTDGDAPANPTESTDDASVEIRVGTDDTRCLYVEDDGPGIPPERRDEVFQSGYTTGTDGTGYGLTIVRQVAQAHEWDVGVTAGSDGGARFEFRGLEFVDD